MTILLRTCFLGFLASLWPCLAHHVAAADERDALPDDVVLLRDLRYRDGDNPRWTLDLAMPREPAKEPRAAIVVVHGGGWIEGGKSSFSTPKDRPPGNIIDLARRGYVAATVEYRLSTEAPFPAALQDCRCAVRWLRAHAADYSIDPHRVGAWGNSAGGHLALLLGLVDKETGLEDDGPHREFSSRVQAVASDSGPLDLAYQSRNGDIRTVVEKFLGGPAEGARLAEYKRASPCNYVSMQAPPLLLVYGVDDSQVAVETADAFVTDLAKAGAREVGYLRLSAVGHCPHSLIRVPWVDAAVQEFFDRALGKKKSP